MPYIVSNGVRIHYEVEGQGPPLIMAHGWTWSIADFYEYGWVKELQNDYQLILIDPRGHGYSDKPHEPAAYNRKLMVQDILVVMDGLNISKACYLGVSMSGHIGFGLLKYAPERIQALLIGASTPYVDKNEMEEWKRSEQYSKLQSGMKLFYEWAIPTSQNLTVTDWFMCRRLADDHEALIACKEGRIGASYEEVLSHNTIPCLIFVGTKDPGYLHDKQYAGEMPNAQFFEIPDRGHGDLFRFTEPLPGIKKFLAEIHA